MDLELDAYDYPLPPECIAQHPPAERDGGRLLALARSSGALTHARVRDLPRFVAPGERLDLLRASLECVIVVTLFVLAFRVAIGCRCGPRCDPNASQHGVLTGRELHGVGERVPSSEYVCGEALSSTR